MYNRQSASPSEEAFSHVCQCKLNALRLWAVSAFLACHACDVIQVVALADTPGRVSVTLAVTELRKACSIFVAPKPKWVSEKDIINVSTYTKVHMGGRFARRDSQVVAHNYASQVPTQVYI
ncbi:hypothetical protein ACLOJK_008966 [Asimina triloba]